MMTWSLKEISFFDFLKLIKRSAGLDLRMKKNADFILIKESFSNKFRFLVDFLLLWGFKVDLFLLSFDVLVIKTQILYIFICFPK